ncbi:hypothetical protein ACPCK9_25110 [Streptomyces koyangensis]|uniref:hypothetical protein n=1 Tax=Streptomyces koyangensis TaxID=188770 RepID=UPI0037006FA8
MNAPRRHAADPDVIAQTTGLVNFLRDMVHSSHQRQRDDRGRDRLRLADLPEQVRRPTPREDGIVLRLDHVSQSTPPELPEVLDGWVDQAACLDADGIDPPLAETGPEHTRLPALSSTVEEGEEDAGTTVVRDQASEVLRAYGPWLQRWRKWAERERHERPLRALYARSTRGISS